MTDDRDVEVNYELTAFVAELRRLADALESGADYAIQIDGETVTLPAEALMSIAHEVESGEVELEFQLTWSTGEEDEEDEEDEGDLVEDADAAKSEETQSVPV
jgi:amphi-Trp domain-containing protein